MEEDVSVKKWQERKKLWGKKTECLDDTSPKDMEEDVSDKTNNKSENNDR